MRWAVRGCSVSNSCAGKGRQSESFLAADRELTDAARLWAEQSLAIDPHQRTALGMLGMALYEEGDYASAINYWERLLAMEPPGSESAAMIQSVLTSARARLAASTGEVAPAPQAAPADSAPASVGVTVQVVLPDGAAVSPGDTVFVLARSATSGSRMPIAVQRFQGVSFPLTVRLDDSSSMAGQKLSQTDSVVVAVQVSADGRPGTLNARWLGEVGPVTPSASGEPVILELRPGGA